MIGESRTPCQDEPELWMSDDKDERRLAAESCKTCPVLAHCLKEAEEINPKHGIWGGLDWSRVDSLATAPRESECLAENCTNRFMQRPKDYYRKMYCSVRCANKARGNRRPTPINHGTDGGARTHLRRGEEPCKECRDAARQAQRARKLRREAS